jgi:hypothetical protein
VLGLLFLSKIDGDSSYTCRHVMMVSEPLIVACNFFSADALMLSTCIRVINNDNGEELEQSTYGILPYATLTPNKVIYGPLCLIHFFHGFRLDIHL